MSYGVINSINEIADKVKTAMDVPYHTNIQKVLEPGSLNEHWAMVTTFLPLPDLTKYE